MTTTQPDPALRHPSSARPVLDHARFGDAPAVLLGAADGHVLSHAELADRVAERAASWGPARRLVLVEAANDLDSLVAYLAALQHGHVALVVPAARPDQRDAVAAAYAPDVVCEPGRPDDVRRHTSGHELHPDLALLLSTSGTTGSPKLVRLSRENVASNAAAIAAYLGLSPADRAITALPLHYCYGLSVLHSHLVAGASVVLTDLRVVDECFWDLFVRAGATSLAGVPHTFDLLATSGFADRALPTLRQVTQAGGRLAPDDVRRWSRLGRERGWDLVVMYGATEATARMAYLPPHLAETHPSAVGVAVPGGRIRLDLTRDDRPGVGELVYTGPNVMLGYAERPADLALGRVVDELRTGDLARERDGLVEIVGRRSRLAKLFGLRIDLDAVEARLRSELRYDLAVVATEGAVHVFLGGGGAAARAAADEAVMAHCGLPPHAVHTRTLPEVPRTGSGKADRGALAALAARAEEQQREGTSPGSIRSDVSLVLGRPDVRASDSFAGLGGDSLSYVELATRLADRFPRGLPPSWHTRPIAELEALAAEAAADVGDGAGDGATGGRAGRRLVRLDTTVVLRALAILFIVVSHVDVAALEGGAHLLLAVAGFNLARFRLSGDDPAPVRLRQGLASLAQLVVPSVLWIGAVALLLGTYDLATTLFVRELVSNAVWDDRWQLWFLESLVWLTVAAIALTSVPALHRLDRAAPFRFALGVLALTVAVRYLATGHRIETPDLYLTASVAFFFALGWAAARAATTPQRLLVSALAAALVVGCFGQTHREAIVLGGFLAMQWLPHVVLVPWLARVAGVLASASLYVYLTHWQVFPPLEDAGHRWLALVASLVVGLAAWQLAKPLAGAVGRAVRGSG